MLLSFNECLETYGNQYQINKMVESKQLYKIEPGLYSENEKVSDIEIVSYKYPKAVFTMDSAFYYHSLTDVIPAQFCLATQKNARLITDNRVKQFFHCNKIFDIGISTLVQGNIKIRIYDQERMLIELIRNKNNLPFDYYKEIIINYRRRTDSLDIEKLQEYISMFPSKIIFLRQFSWRCFDVGLDDVGVSLLINSKEQMFTEKLRSVLKFGPLSTRYKDIFDIYYLCENIDRNKYRRKVSKKMLTIANIKIF